jgi:hypothetical protein
MLLLTSLYLPLALLAYGQDTSTQQVETSLMNAAVIPDVFPSNFTPSFPFEVMILLLE